MEDLIQLIILVVLVGTAALGRFLTKKVTPGGTGEDRGETFRKLARKLSELEGGKPIVVGGPEDMTEEEQEVILFGKPVATEEEREEIRPEVEAEKPSPPLRKTWIAPESAVREFLDEQAEEESEARGLPRPVVTGPEVSRLKRRRDQARPVEGVPAGVSLLTPEMFHDHAQLRRAIVLMEILGKPVGDRP